jgi:hypothetical protein
MQELVRAFTLASRARVPDHARPQPRAEGRGAVLRMQRVKAPAGPRTRFAQGFARRVRRLA